MPVAAGDGGTAGCDRRLHTSEPQESRSCLGAQDLTEAQELTWAWDTSGARAGLLHGSQQEERLTLELTDSGGTPTRQGQGSSPSACSQQLPALQAKIARAWEHLASCELRHSHTAAQLASLTLQESSSLMKRKRC